MTFNRLLLAGAVASSFALAGCATLEEGIVAGTSQTYSATLNGSAEVGGGDMNGSGKADISVSDELGQVCWDLNDIRGIGPITAAHIHRGAAGTNGPPVFTLKPAEEGGYKGCADASDNVQELLEDSPEMLYVNVHTAEYPNGAIRGQLRR